MKLIECYVDNFGKLSSYSHTFSDGLNLIIGKNGCGKTTLSVFIKTMLFGFDTKKTKSEENDRKRYLPWQGGRYGGSLTFESGGKKYRIERSFGQRPSEDSFAIYDTESGAQSKDFTENVGEELFGIDADGFERTVFLSEKKFAVNGNNPKVAAKLSNLVGVDGDMGSYDSALETLEKREKHYRHRRGKGGLIGDINAEIAELDVKMVELTRKKGEHAEIEKELSSLTGALAEAEQKKNELENKRLKLAYEEEYRAKLTAVNSLKEKLCEKKEFFSRYTPTAEELRGEERKQGQALFLKQTIDSLPRPKTVIEEEDIANIKKHISALEALKNRKNANNSYYFHLFLSLFVIGAAVACGLLFNVLFFAISLLSLPFIFLFVKGNKANKKAKADAIIIEKAASFTKEKTGQIIHPDMLCARLNELCASLIAQKAENERITQTIEKNTAEFNALTASYNEFLSKFPTKTEDRFEEIREHLSAYESIKRQAEDAEAAAARYASEKGLDADLIDVSKEVIKISAEDIANAAAEVKALGGARYTLESRLISLFESISMEDVLKEERLELTDKLKKAESEHSVILKTAEHLKAAKERLTAKYLGKMRTAFDSYVSSITEESANAFSLDTDFSLSKTENGLTNKIASYSLGTQEIYALITRLSLVDALYEENEPFIILDDPFCHFDDNRCEAAIKALGSISRSKQIIYLTCSESRTPS